MRVATDPPAPGCAAQCRACSHRGLAAAESTSRKQARLSEILATWKAELQPIRVLPDAARWRYRDRVTLTTRWQAGGWQFGLMRRDRFVAVPNCPVHSDRVGRGLSCLADYLPPPGHLPLAWYVQNGRQVTLVLKHHTLPVTDWISRGLRERLADTGIEALWLHANPCAGRHLFARQTWRLAWGAPLSRTADGLLHGPTAFLQVTPRLAEQALAVADAFLDAEPGQPVVDLYCGIGTSLSRWARRDAKCIGIELGGEAVGCARLNAPGALVLRGTCATRIPQLRTWLRENRMPGRECLLYANPPRAGLENRVLEWISGEARPLRIAYLSCNAGTLRRDLDTLCGAGYRVRHAIPFDFFPHTHHVETLALLERGAS